MSLVARVARTDPDLVRLAQEVCLATRVDPALLRNARLALGLPVEIEARLWFSPLVQTRSPAGFVLAPHVLPELRRALGRSDGLDAAWRRVQEMHAHLPDAVRLEEELAYHAVADASEERLEQVLAPAAAALRDPSRKGVDLWARRALSRLPERAQSVPAAREIAKELDLLDADVPPDPNGGDWTRRVTLLDGQQGLNMRLVGDTLQLGAIEDTTGAVYVMGATSEPNLVEVRYGGRSRIVAVQSSTLRELRGVTAPVTIRFADGAGYALVDRAQLVQELLDAVAERGTSLEELEARLRAAGSLAEPAPVDSGVIWEAFRRYQSIHGLEGDLDGALTRLREDGSTGSAILILHSEDTLAWADYLRSELTRAGHRVRIATPRDAAASEDGMLQAGERLLGIVSPALVLDEAARALLLPPDVAVDILEMPNVFLGGMAGRPSYAEIPNRRNAALRPPADADTLVRALAELELFIEPVGPTPPLPPFLEPVDEDTVYTAINVALERGVDFGLPEDAEPFAGVWVWGSFLSGRTPRNAAAALLAYTAQKLGETGYWERWAAPTSEARWVWTFLRAWPETEVLPFVRQISPSARINLGSSAEWTRELGMVTAAAAEKSVAEALDRIRHRGSGQLGFDPPPEPTVLHVEGDLAIPLEMVQTTPIVRSHPGFLENRQIHAQEEVVHLLVGPVEPWLEGPRLVHAMGAHDIELPTPPRILIADIHASERFEGGLRRLFGSLPVFPREGLVVLRVLVTPEERGIFEELQDLVEQAAGFAHATGPDTVVLRIVDAGASPEPDRRLLEALRAGGTVGDAVLRCASDAHPCFVWSDPLMVPPPWPD